MVQPFCMYASQSNSIFSMNIAEFLLFFFSFSLKISVFQYIATCEYVFDNFELCTKISNYLLKYQFRIICKKIIY